MVMGKEMHFFLSHLDSHEFQELWTQYSSVYHWACYLYEWFHSVEFGPAFLWQYSVCINTHANNILKWYKFYDAEFQAYTGYTSYHLIVQVSCGLWETWAFYLIQTDQAGIPGRVCSPLPASCLVAHTGRNGNLPVCLIQVISNDKYQYKTQDMSYIIYQSWTLKGIGIIQKSSI